MITTLLFLAAIFILPVFKVIPSAAAACGLVYVGVLMMSTVTNVDFSDVRVAVPAFLTIAGMPFFYSITDGIGIGLISYVVINIICYAIDMIIWSVRTKKIAAASVNAAPAAADSAPVDGEGTIVSDADAPAAEAAAPAVPEKPKWTISVVTGIIVVLFLVMYLVPLAV